VTIRRVLPAVVVVLLTSTALAGCGGGGSSKPEAAKSTATRAPLPTDTNTKLPALPKKFKLERPKAKSTILPSATLSAVPGSSEIYSAADARTIEGFPVPKGAKVKDPGALEETWQFDIATTDPTKVLDFYKSVLPQMGYTVRTDVTYTLAYEPVHWDIVFDGKVSGSMAVDKKDHTVFVVVNPPGQAALPGDQ
jgi:hypothetical protein